MIVRFRLLFSLLALLLNLRANAQLSQDIFSNLRKQLSVEDSTAEHADVFLHIDKTVYPVTEDIWFSAYLLRTDIPEGYHTLHLALINDMSGKVAVAERYVIYNGLSSGCLAIPDTLDGGEYSLIAYTNKSLNKTKQNYFRQALTIIGGVKPPFDISFVSPVSKTSKDSAQIIFRIGTAYGGLASKGTIEYNLYRNDRFLKNGNVKIDAFGEAPLLTTAKDITDRYEVTGRVYRDKD
ncbi:MAG: hypothetical protein ABW036_13410, partial [Flavitalea sp.]